MTIWYFCINQQLLLHSVSLAKRARYFYAFKLLRINYFSFKNVIFFIKYREEFLSHLIFLINSANDRIKKSLSEQMWQYVRNSRPQRDSRLSFHSLSARISGQYGTIPFAVTTSKSSPRICAPILDRDDR